MHIDTCIYMYIIIILCDIHKLDCILGLYNYMYVIFLNCVCIYNGVSTRVTLLANTHIHVPISERPPMSMV